jgi:hypothetical protein
MFLVRIFAQLLAVHTGNVYCIAVFWWQNLMVDLGLNGRLILGWIFKKQDGRGGAMDWIDLVQERDRWRAHMDAVMKPSGFINCGEFLDLLRSYELLKKICDPW